MVRERVEAATDPDPLLALALGKPRASADYPSSLLKTCNCSPAPSLGSGVGLCSDHLYLPFFRHTTPESLQPFRVSLPKELWWIITLEVLWRSADLAWMPSPRFPLRILSATSTPWAPTSTMPPRPSRRSFFRWPLANTRLLVILLPGPLQVS